MSIERESRERVRVERDVERDRVERDVERDRVERDKENREWRTTNRIE